MGINQATEQYMATLADNADRELPETDRLNLHKEGIRKRDARITELEIALSSIITAWNGTVSDDIEAALNKASDVLGRSQ